jgi:uracil-DNA glycosylase family 4
MHAPKPDLSTAALLTDWDALNAQIVGCAQCPRLVAHRTRVAQQKRAQYRDWDYWGKPVPNFGEPTARLLIVGLAPAAHGGNRTGRIFTGDASGDFLFDALYRTGFCNQPTSTHREDGLRLYDVAITAAVHCAPPGNKPTLDEQRACFPYLRETYRLMPNLRGLLALGQLAFDACVRLAREGGTAASKVYAPNFGTARFTPSQAVAFWRRATIPSARNTYTKLLTRAMMTDLLLQVRARLEANPTATPADSAV